MTVSCLTVHVVVLPNIGGLMMVPCTVFEGIAIVDCTNEGLPLSKEIPVI